MKFRELLEIVGAEPLFETGLLLSGDVDPKDIRRQISRWTRSGRVVKLRRGLYSLGEPYRKVHPHPFVVSNHLQRPSYVSLHSALAHHGLIPEHVPQTTASGLRQIWSSSTTRWSRPAGTARRSPATAGAS